MLSLILVLAAPLFTSRNRQAMQQSYVLLNSRPECMTLLRVADLVMAPPESSVDGFRVGSAQNDINRSDYVRKTDNYIRQAEAYKLQPRQPDWEKLRYVGNPSLGAILDTATDTAVHSQTFGPTRQGRATNHHR